MMTKVPPNQWRRYQRVTAGVSSLAAAAMSQRIRLGADKIAVVAQNTAIGDDHEPCVLCLLLGGGVGHAVLEPESLGADRDRRVRDGRDLFGSSKDVDDVHRTGHVFELRVAGTTEQLFAREGRVDADDVV